MTAGDYLSAHHSGEWWAVEALPSRAITGHTKRNLMSRCHASSLPRLAGKRRTRRAASAGHISTRFLFPTPRAGSMRQ